MKHKKFIFILINTLIALILIELLSYQVLYYRYKDNYGKQFIKYSKINILNDDKLLTGFRPTEYRDKNKPPIFVFGCSYVQGTGLNDNQTVSRKLADYTNRTVYNRGKSGLGIYYFYYLLNNEKIIKDLPKNPQYIIWILIPDHVPRMYRYRSVPLGIYNFRSKIKNGQIVTDNISCKFLHSFFTSIVLEEFIAKCRYENKSKTDFMFIKLFKESDKLIKKNFPNTKLVVVSFDLYNYIPADYYRRLQLLKEEIPDIQIIDINKEIPDIADKRYIGDDKVHPNEQAWDKIVPVLAKKLNL